MPNFNHKGPKGLGSKTGKKTGKCRKTEVERKEMEEINFNRNELLKNLNKMKKIAVPITPENQIENHFGHCQSYEIYTFSETNEVLDLQLIDSEKNCGCKSDIINVLANNGVTFMLSGTIGDKAKSKLNDAGIEVIRGCSGDSSTVILEFVEGNIFDNGISCLQHTQN